jgi:hypothetical protein
MEKEKNEKKERKEKENEQKEKEKSKENEKRNDIEKNENYIGKILTNENGDENSGRNEKELTETYAQKAIKTTSGPKRPLARMIDPDMKPQVFHRRYFKVRFSGQALRDRRQQYSQTWKLLESLSIRPLVKQISLIGRSTVELYVAEINLLQVETKIKALVFDPTNIPTDSTFDLKEATIRRLGRLLSKTNWKNLQDCILRGYSEEIQERARHYNSESQRQIEHQNDAQIIMIDTEDHKENQEKKQKDKETPVNHGKE